MIDEKRQIEEMDASEVKELVDAIYEIARTYDDSIIGMEDIICEAVIKAGYRKQKVGEWVYREDEFGRAYYACQICDCQTRHKENYCSCCGAIMEGEKEDG